MVFGDVKVLDHCYIARFVFWTLDECIESKLVGKV